MPKPSHDRHLAKNAERRRQARRRADRNKKAALGVGGAIGIVLLILLGIALLSRNDEPTTAGGATPLPTVSSTGSAAPGPTQIGTVPPGVPATQEVACGAQVPAAADAAKPQFDRAPTPDEVLRKGTSYTAVVETSCGTIKIELDDKAAPQTVASFVFLAEQGYFDGQFFHRVVDSIDVVQGGDPTGAGNGGPGYSIPDELTGSEHYAPGTVAMANAGANTGGSQFFLVTGPRGANLDGNPAYTIFGTMTKGLDVATQINGLMATNDGSYDGAPTEAVYIDSVTIERSKTPSASPSPSPSA